MTTVFLCTVPSLSFSSLKFSHFLLLRLSDIIALIKIIKKKKRLFHAKSHPLNIDIFVVIFTDRQAAVYIIYIDVPKVTKQIVTCHIGHTISQVLRRDLGEMLNAQVNVVATLFIEILKNSSQTSPG